MSPIGIAYRQSTLPRLSPLHPSTQLCLEKTPHRETDVYLLMTNAIIIRLNLSGFFSKKSAPLRMHNESNNNTQINGIKRTFMYSVCIQSTIVLYSSDQIISLLIHPSFNSFIFPSARHENPRHHNQLSLPCQNRQLWAYLGGFSDSNAPK